ncbi:MAG TPA: hypothetical protein VKD72_37535, partial [Gemmataceae bacterium]|nr:hypothetical protein [Gemmataceae bacterium]
GAGWRVYADPGRGKPLQDPIREEKALVATEPHVENFLDCIKAHRDPNAPVEVGHSAVAGPHLANYALRNRRRAVLSPRGKIIGG